jgi:phosphoglycolate phosphatase
MEAPVPIEPGRIGAVAFDLDGTLIDSAPDIAAALNSALLAARLPCFDLATVRVWIGDGPDALIASALATLGHDDASAELCVELRRGFDAATLAAPLRHGAVCAGVDQMVAALHGVLPMVVVSNKPTHLARAVLQAAQLLPFMAQVFGADTPAQRKPAPALLHDAARSLGIRPAELLMVGDSVNDLEAARAAGCPAALVGWGYGAHAVPTGSDALRVAAPAQLLAHLLRARYE